MSMIPGSVRNKDIVGTEVRTTEVIEDAFKNVYIPAGTIVKVVNATDCFGFEIEAEKYFYRGFPSDMRETKKPAHISGIARYQIEQIETDKKITK